MVKVILQLYPVVRAEDESERESLRPLGRNPDRFQEAINDLPLLAQAVDDLGLWGISTVEHHFHSEGYEIGPTPGIMATHLAGLTKRVRVGQLGYTMSAQNPIRVAEETALIDHLTRGRCFVGFSRGYQARWTNILGQHVGARATASPDGLSEEERMARDPALLAKEKADDRLNRDVFEEHVDMVVRAWTQDSLRYRSSRWQLPYPYEEGIDWAMSNITRRFGAVDELDDNGRVRAVSVCPAPFSKPYPPVFIASNASKETVEYSGRMGFVPTYFSPIGKAAEFGLAYVEQAAAAGHRFALGQNQAIVRWTQIEDTAEQAHQAIRDFDVELYRNLYRPLTPVMRYDEQDPVGSVLGSGLFTAGTVDQVRQQFVSQWSELPAEYVVLIFHYAQMPASRVISTLERFMSGVKPTLDAMTEYAVVG